MKTCASVCERFFRDDRGVAEIEYALLASLIAVICAVTLIAMGTDVNAMFVLVCNEVTRAVGGAPAC